LKGSTNVVLNDIPKNNVGGKEKTAGNGIGKLRSDLEGGA